MEKDRRGALRIAALYALFGALWIAVSDRLLAVSIPEASEAISRFQTYKGWFFILVTALLVYELTRRTLAAQSRLLEALSVSEGRYRRLNAELEQRVAQRTAQVEAVNKELEAFSYAVSHDLKAPLRIIDGFSRNLAEDYAALLDANGRKYLDSIHNGVVHMNALIRDILAYSRMERVDLQDGPVEVAIVVAAILDERKEDIDAGAVAVTVSVPALSVRADPKGLEMVLRNLLDNALKFRRDGVAPAIEIGARLQNERALVWVRDNGIGFDMEYQDRIFEMFQRLEKAEAYPGTGVGLALVHKALQRMGGRVWVESRSGEGTTFFVELAV